MTAIRRGTSPLGRFDDVLFLDRGPFVRLHVFDLDVVDGAPRVRRAWISHLDPHIEALR